LGCNSFFDGLGCRQAINLKNMQKLHEESPSMPTNKVNKSLALALAKLQGERDRIEGAIAKLENVLGQTASSASTRRGTTRSAGRGRIKVPRTPVVTKERSRAGWTQAARDAAAERMRRYWASLADGEGKAARARKTSKRAEKADKAEKTRSARRSTSGWTDSARGKAAERMRKYWAERRSAAQVTG
jgi:hypothetical protein